MLTNAFPCLHPNLISCEPLCPECLFPPILRLHPGCWAPPASGCPGHHSKVPPSGQLAQQKCVSAQFWRLEV